VQLIEASSTKVIWAYSVNKQKGGSKNSQSMAEAIAKHLKEFVEQDPKKGATLTTVALQTTTMQPESSPTNNVQAEPPAQPATVIVKSTPPGADINVDGKWMGSTPSTIQLVPGDHQVSIEQEGMTPWQRTMTITAGGSSTINATLVKP
jgi:hypothetical protein